ncbi:MAG: hypothetical protein BWK80_47080 [Desulfobacteraceae bacterium IS3]|nr:MAG: hypothetical protein BWK80_47080 [Desulfobacteraceae bacterium IS3]HAO23340.1 hypothetical protein [Desulfobacteraceae bacterium]
MATIQDFGKRILQIPGITQYLLVRNDGKVMAHNVDAPESLASVILFCGLNCDAIGSVAGLTYLKYLMLTRKNNEKLLIFPMDTYFLGIIQNADAYSPEIVDSVIRLVQMVIKPKKTS